MSLHSNCSLIWHFHWIIDFEDYFFSSMKLMSWCIHTSEWNHLDFQTLWDNHHIDSCLRISICVMHKKILRFEWATLSPSEEWMKKSITAWTCLHITNVPLLILSIRSISQTQIRSRCFFTLSETFIVKDQKYLSFLNNLYVSPFELLTSLTFSLKYSSMKLISWYTHMGIDFSLTQVRAY